MTDPSPLGLGPRLRELREAAGLTQTELAARVPGLNQGRVGAYERGERHPSERTAGKLADALGVDLFALIGSATELAWPPQVILLRAGADGVFRPARAEDAERLRSIGLARTAYGSETIGLLIADAHAQGRSVAFDPARHGEPRPGA